ncbi:unnamed protein product [Larinioides sclopetarius]|uniref:Uncharacterized protein n=1 Tax=Larinioides sclopetarius TaxID=280406 RepID=A0AAV1Z160_9ARAC
MHKPNDNWETENHFPASSKNPHDAGENLPYNQTIDKRAPRSACKRGEGSREHHLPFVTFTSPHLSFGQEVSLFPVAKTELDEQLDETGKAKRMRWEQRRDGDAGINMAAEGLAYGWGG